MIRALLDLDRSAQRFYTRAHLGGDAIGWRDEPPDEALLDSLGSPCAVLDAGCGSGRHTIALAQRGWRATGIDLFERPLTTARRRARGTGAAFVKGSVTEADTLFMPRRFDLVLDVLGPASDLTSRALGVYARALTTVLSPGGRMVIVTFLGPDELEPLLAPFESMEVEGSSELKVIRAGDARPFRSSSS